MAVKRKKRKTVPEPFPTGKPTKEDIDSTREFLRETGGEAAVAMYDAGAVADKAEKQSDKTPV